MQSYEVIGSRWLNQPSGRGPVLGTGAVHPLSGPLARFEKSLDATLCRNQPSGRSDRHSLLLAMAVGLVTQLMFSWTLGRVGPPAWP